MRVYAFQSYVSFQDCGPVKQLNIVCQLPGSVKYMLILARNFDSRPTALTEGGPEFTRWCSLAIGGVLSFVARLCLHSLRPNGPGGDMHKVTNDHCG